MTTQEYQTPYAVTIIAPEYSLFPKILTKLSPLVQVLWTSKLTDLIHPTPLYVWIDVPEGDIYTICKLKYPNLKVLSNTESTCGTLIHYDQLMPIINIFRSIERYVYQYTICRCMPHFYHDFLNIKEDSAAFFTGTAYFNDGDVTAIEKSKDDMDRFEEAINYGHVLNHLMNKTKGFKIGSTKYELRTVDQ